jgi:PAS domain S-box-containing protein
MKLPKITLAIIVLCIVGMILLSRYLVQQEEKTNIRSVQEKGINLVNLLSLYPIMDYNPEKRAFFLQSLTSYQGLTYLLVHDKAGRIIVNLAPSDILSNIPPDIQTNSIYALGITTQSFAAKNLHTTIYEFAKPVFKSGQKAGTIRLGFKLPASSAFSLERMSFLAMVAFFILSAVLLVYYGITLAMKPLRNRHRDLFNVKGNSGKKPAQGDNLIPMIEDLEQSLSFMHEKLNEMKITNIELNSKVGVMNFEKNQFIRILDSINLGVLITDMHNNIRNINEYLLKLFNRKRETVVDHPLEEIFHQNDLVSFVIHQDTIEHQGNMNYRDMSFPDQAPGEVFRVNLTHFTGAEGTPIGKVITFRNITSVRMVQKAQQEFIAHVAHELRTPLTNIKSYSELLMDQEVESAEMQKEFYNIINQETARLTDLIQNLMSLSKMEMGGLTINKGLLRTDWLVEGSLAAVEASARDKGITIEKKLPDIFPSIMADKELLKSAIINVLGNAVKYTPADGKIMFSIFEQDSAMIIEITDTGYGLDPKDLPHVFEKFYRSNSPLVAQQTGSGLGLAITAEIVHLHDGEIEVQSKLGEGSRFTIKIPKEDYLLGNQ